MQFEKRDIILITGCLFLMIGLIPFIAVYQALIIASLIFLGIKFYVSNRKKTLAEKVGEGICIECGEKIIDKKCPNCDFASK